MARGVTQPFRGHRIVLAAAVVAVFVAACSGGNPTQATDPPTGPGAATGSAAPGLPGVKEFGLSDEEFAAHVEAVQTGIADCMKEAGFEYVPVDVATIERAQESVRQEPGLSRRQYKEKWGLSVTTRFDDPVRTIGLGPQNIAIIEGLAEADREAYNLTLFGENRDSDFAFTLDEEDFSSTGGCTRAAVAAVFTPDQLEGNYVNPKDVLVQEDPRVIEARANWTSCMQDAGYTYDDQDTIIDEYGERLDALTEGDDPATLTGARLDALHALQAEEIAVALKDLDCQEKFTDAVLREVEIEVFGHPVSG